MNFKIASVVNLVAALLYLLSNSVMIALTLVLIALFYYDTDKNNLLEKRKTSLLIVSILSFPLVFVSSIFIFIELYKNKEEKKDELTKEQKKIDVLLKLGAFMIGLSGIIITTSRIDLVGEYTRIIILLLVAALLFGMSYLSKKVFKIEKTIETYFVLSMMFILFAYLSAISFGLIDNFITSNDLQAALFFALVFGIFLTVGFNFKRNIYHYIKLIGLFLSLNFVMMHFNFDLDVRFIIISILVIGLNLLKEKEYNKNFLLITSLIVLPFTYLFNLISFNNYVLSIIAVGLINGNLYYEYSKKVKDEKRSVFVSFITLLILFATVINIKEIALEHKMIVLTVIMGSIYLKTIFVKLPVLIKNHLRIFINISFFIILVLSNTNVIEGILKVGNSTSLAISGVILLTNLMYILFDNKNANYEYYLQPFKLALFTYFLLLVMNIELQYVYHILYMITFFMFLVFKDNKMKYIYLSSTFILIIYSMFTGYTTHLILGILHILVPYIAMLVVSRGVIKELYKNIVYSGFIIVLLLELTYIDIIFNDLYRGSLIGILILTLFSVAYQNNEERFNITRYLTTIPLISLMINSPISNEAYIMLTRTVFIYLLYLFNRTIFVDNPYKKHLNIVLLSIIMLSMVFTESLFISMFIAVISLGLIYISFKYKEYNYLFYIAVVSIIVNIVVQLRDIWQSIPFWAYLLMFGLLLIATVTYLEVKKQRK